MDKPAPDPNKLLGYWEEWERGAGWERIKVPATECPRIPREFLAEERRSMGERVFRQEYLCEFGDLREGVFNMDSVKRAFKSDIPALVPAWRGVFTQREQRDGR